MKITDPAVYFREQAELLEAFSPPAARAYEDAAAKFEEWIRQKDFEPLTLQEASYESGYTAKHLRRRVLDGDIPNAGTPEDPRIYRCHVPRKPGYGIAHARLRVASSRAQAARAIASGG